MLFTGIADEAGKTVEAQIAAHKTLGQGWRYLELRTIDGVNVVHLVPVKFHEAFTAIKRAGFSVSCFASKIGDWSRPITGKFQDDVDDLTRAIPLMRQFGTRFIRVMSWPNDREYPLSPTKWRTQAIERMKRLADIAEHQDVILVHENCSGWGGQSAQNCLDLLKEIGSPNLKVLYDTGNPVQYGQDPWTYYETVRDLIAYVHIKDATRHPGDKEETYTLPGDGEGCVKDVLRDLYERGYKGFISIEPHLAAIIHQGKEAADPEEAFRNYVQYGQKLMEIVQEVYTT